MDQSARTKGILQNTSSVGWQAVRNGAGWFVALLAWCFLLRWPTLLPSVIDSDESLYILIAEKWRHGHPPYQAIWDHKPPGVYLLFAVTFSALGESVLSIRILASAFVFAAAMLLYSIAYVCTGDRAAARVPAIAYPAFSLLWRGTAANVEHFFIVFNLAAALFLAMTHCMKPTGARRWRNVILTGLCFGIALQLKYIAVFEVAFLYVAYALFEWRNVPAERRGTLIGELALMVTLAIVPTAVAAIYFFRLGQIGEFVTANFHANLRHATPEFSAKTFISGLLSFLRWLVQSSPLWFGSALLFVGRRSLAESPSAHSYGRSGVLVAWVVVGLVEASSTARFYAHYYLVTLAPLCLLAGEAWRTGAVIRSRFQSSIAWAGVVCAFPIFFISLLDYRPWVIDWLTGERDEPTRVASYIRGRLEPGEAIYIGNGEPIIYFLANASIPTRFAFPPFLMDEHFSAVAGVDYRREFRRILNQRPRCLVLGMKTHPREREFRAMLESDYPHQQRFSTVEVFCRG